MRYMRGRATCTHTPDDHYPIWPKLGVKQGLIWFKNLGGRGDMGEVEVMGHLGGPRGWVREGRATCGKLKHKLILMFP